MFFKFKDILYNFDNSLIKCTKKYKISKTNEFITSDKMNHSNTKECPTSIITNDEVFVIKSTNTPDIYTLFNVKTNVFVGNACVNSLMTSKFLHSIFNNSTLNTSFKVNCSFNKKFEKWVPISKC